MKTKTYLTRIGGLLTLVCAWGIGGATLAVLPGCDDNDVEDAARDLGDGMGDAADNVGDAMEDAADNVEDAVN